MKSLGRRIAWVIPVLLSVMAWYRPRWSTAGIA